MKHSKDQDHDVQRAELEGRHVGMMLASHSLNPYHATCREWHDAWERGWQHRQAEALREIRS